ncbi:small ribosomal subunit protein uS5m [Lethenteron reissneri]|uniref:small ribosomal subunit protein uS5m n=1 Tax=Lethenteron reissneri TaxID=7753 RepID=UPI002AB5FB62|nr:small ribosomal subunit protein uS5m [Lethenteron reissneri]
MAASWRLGSCLLRAVALREGVCAAQRCPRSLFSTVTLGTLTPRGAAVAPVVTQPRRHGSFFNKLTADELWKGVVANSGSAMRKGRGKRAKRKFKKNLNFGQTIGEGQGGFLWPGLNMPIRLEDGVQKPSRRSAAEQLEMQANMLLKRDEWDKKKRFRLKTERGWSGRNWGGISLGPPDPSPNGDTYEDFDSRVIEVRNVFHMTGKEGRKKSCRALVVVGNKKGAAGFAIGKAPERTAALRKAKNMAIHYLYYIERYNDHTVYENFNTTYRHTAITVKKMPRGQGLHCHRAIITMCRLIGIEDMYAKVTGSVNLINMTKAFFLGLTTQETHQQAADRSGLHVVELRDETGPLPVVVASPRTPVSTTPLEEDAVSLVPPDWNDVKRAHGLGRSKWSGVKRTVAF